MERYYMPLKLHRVAGKVSYIRPMQELPAKVNLDSPAIFSMTDLRQVTALTVEAHVSIEWALERMRNDGVRLLFVVNHDGDVEGLITSNDIQGHKPLQLLRETRVRRAEIRVRDVMTPISDFECILFEDVMAASVGHVLETLNRVGRQHALVCECDQRTGPTMIRGIFSARRLSQQLGIQFEPVTVADTFAAVESALASH